MRVPGGRVGPLTVLRHNGRAALRSCGFAALRMYCCAVELYCGFAAKRYCGIAVNQALSTMTEWNTRGRHLPEGNLKDCRPNAYNRAILRKGLPLASAGAQGTITMQHTTQRREVNTVRIHADYMHKENRDARARALTAQGYRVKKSSMANQRMHPMYIEDYEGPEKYDTGFGNTVYQTFFAHVYTVETIR